MPEYRDQVLVDALRAYLDEKRGEKSSIGNKLVKFDAERDIKSGISKSYVTNLLSDLPGRGSASKSKDDLVVQYMRSIGLSLNRETHRFERMQSSEIMSIDISGTYHLVYDLGHSSGKQIDGDSDFGPYLNLRTFHITHEGQDKSSIAGRYISFHEENETSFSNTPIEGDLHFEVGRSTSSLLSVVCCRPDDRDEPSPTFLLRYIQKGDTRFFFGIGLGFHASENNTVIAARVLGFPATDFPIKESAAVLYERDWPVAYRHIEECLTSKSHFQSESTFAMSGAYICRDEQRGVRTVMIERKVRKIYAAMKASPPAKEVKEAETATGRSRRQGRKNR